jgi:hypothetical protein
LISILKYADGRYPRCHRNDRSQNVNFTSSGFQIDIRHLFGVHAFSLSVP